MSYLKKMDIKFVNCPFNKQHRVQEFRLQYHIARCEKNYPGYAVCPYNACHRMQQDEFRAHLHVCPSKQRIQVIPDLERNEGALSHADRQIIRNFNYENGENWDE